MANETEYEVWSAHCPGVSLRGPDLQRLIDQARSSGWDDLVAAEMELLGPRMGGIAWRNIRTWRL
jgi:hypothetical protein